MDIFSVLFILHSFRQFFCQSAGDPVDDQHQQKQYNRDSVGLVHIQTLSGEIVHMDSQCGAWGHYAWWYLSHSSRGIDQSGCLAYDPAHRQDNTGQYAGNGAGQYDAEDGAQFSGAQAKASLTEGVRNGFQGLLCGPHYEGKDHDRQCQGNEFESIVIAQEKLFDHRNLYAAEKFWWNMLKPVDRPSNMLYNVNNESRDADKWL